jgi:hypothetical protein
VAPRERVYMDSNHCPIYCQQKKAIMSVYDDKERACYCVDDTQTGLLPCLEEDEGKTVWSKRIPHCPRHKLFAQPVERRGADLPQLVMQQVQSVEDCHLQLKLRRGPLHAVYDYAQRTCAIHLKTSEDCVISSINSVTLDSEWLWYLTAPNCTMDSLSESGVRLA